MVDITQGGEVVEGGSGKGSKRKGLGIKKGMKGLARDMQVAALEAKDLARQAKKSTKDAVWENALMM